MIRCIRMWTGEDGNSLFEEGTVELNGVARGDDQSPVIAVNELTFRETVSGGSWGLAQRPRSSLCHHTHGHIRVRN
ncbi:Uncharacterised protein [Providencia alcalifaciens]|nr:Uncharacterised protein [Providencia alcalifaciens]